MLVVECGKNDALFFVEGGKRFSETYASFRKLRDIPTASLESMLHSFSLHTEKPNETSQSSLSSVQKPSTPIRARL